MTGSFLNQKRILLLLWHPDTPTLSSGGFIRIKKFLKETPDDFIIDVLDNYPTIFKKEEVTGEIYQYKISGLIRHIENKFFLLGRFFEGWVSFLSLVKKGFSLNKSRRYDVVYLPTGETFTVFAAIVLRKLCNVKVVLDSLNIDMPCGSWRNYYVQLRRAGYSMAHAIFLPSYIYLVLPVLIKCFNKVDYIVTVSPYLMKKLQKLGVKTPIDFTPSGIDYLHFADKPREKKKYDGIFIGRHEVAKGIFDLINAWKVVVNNYHPAKLLMVGFCDKYTWKIINHKLKENNLLDNILLAGELSEADKIKSIKQSKIYIHLSPMEPLFPVISILEGLACGLPLVGYDCPSYQETEDRGHNKAISLVTVGDYEKAALQILRYLQLGQSEIEEVSRTAQEYAKRFNWKQISAKQFNIIRNLTQRDR